LDKYHITTRTISEAIYVFNHPAGDPFTLRRPANDQEAVLFGLGIGLYWAIGNKANTGAIRLSSTDAKLITKFIDFLKTFFAIPKNDFRFGLQISTDITPRSALDFWTKELKISRKQFYKVTVTKSGSLGAYRRFITSIKKRETSWLVYCRCSSVVEQLHGRQLPTVKAISPRIPNYG
jgi:hypothetical protein